MKYALSETGFEINVQQEMDSKGYNWSPDNGTKILDILFKSIATYLHSAKSDKADSAVAIRNNAGDLIFGAIVSYDEGNEDTPASWQFSMTLNDDDLIGITNTVLSTDPRFVGVFSSVGFNLHGMNIRHTGASDILITSVATNLIKLITDVVNAKQEPVSICYTSIDDPDIFELCGDIENDKIVISIVPGSELKTLIKGDAVIEK